jgi:N,N'-diacetyllegionaminate synthase
MTKPFIIGEVGSNFDQSLSKAKKYIDIVKSCGADAVKFQLFSGKVLYPNDKKMQKIFNTIELNINWVDKLIKYSDKKKIKIFFSCFDEFRVNFLIKKGIKIHKIASSEVENFKIFKNLNKKKFEVFLSTGMSDLDDITKIYRKMNNCKLIIMQCTSLYPTSEKDVNLNVISSFKKKFKKAQIGFSDHTTSDVAALTALGMGAKYFEKHITLNKKSKGPDHFYAYEPSEFKRYVKNIHASYNCLGIYDKQINSKVRKIARLKGIYSNIALKKNQIMKREFITYKSPAIGLRKKDIKLILGKKLKINVRMDEPLKLKFFK